jgi:imidazoleglycerol-phosphate dehydratase
MASREGKGTRERKSSVKRETRETSVRVEVDLDRPAEPRVRTGIGFFDHMLASLAQHGRLGLTVEAVGDLHVDQHHLVEDVGIALGSAIREALGEDLRLKRFASSYAPLDEALARAVVDVSGRAHLSYGVAPSRPLVGGFDADLVREFFQALVANARITLHIDLLRGSNAHHEIEAVFKATALALRGALEKDESLGGIPSTKGTLSEGAARKRK